MENIKKIKDLTTAANDLEELPARYAKITSDSSCDKHAFCFGGDDRFSVFSVKVFLDCHKGYYGNSGCSTVVNVDNGVAQRALNKILNKRRDEILSEMAAEIRNEALTLEAKARKELQQMSADLDAITMPKQLDGQE